MKHFFHSQSIDGSTNKIPETLKNFFWKTILIYLKRKKSALNIVWITFQSFSYYISFSFSRSMPMMYQEETKVVACQAIPNMSTKNFRVSTRKQPYLPTSMPCIIHTQTSPCIFSKICITGKIQLLTLWTGDELTKWEDPGSYLRNGLTFATRNKTEQYRTLLQLTLSKL